MRRFMKKRSKKAGLPPGSLVHIGEQKSGVVALSVVEYSDASFMEMSPASLDQCSIRRDRDTMVWINVEGIHDTLVLEKLSDCFGLHPLVREDIMNTDQRPKVEDYGTYLYIVLKMLHTRNASGEINAEQISFIVGENFVISFQEGVAGDVFDPVRERLRSNKGRLRKAGSDYLAYSLIDAVVDRYFIILEQFGEHIESLEEKIVTTPAQETLRAIHTLKRELIFLRRAVWPLREVVAFLERGDAPFITESTRIYFRDVYDHAVQVIDTIETFRDMTSSMLDIYLSSVSNRLNAVMKVLTIIATIFMPLTFLAGIYGMNFEYMPELKWRWGYPVVLLVMIGTGFCMLYYFRKKKWM